MADKFIGVQLGSHSVFDEGVEHCLDILQETAGVNAVFVYSHMHHRGFATGRTIGALAPDHGAPPLDPTTREFTNVWVEAHDEYYAGTFLRNHRYPGKQEYADRDILAELIEPAHRRGVQVFARILEGYGAELAAQIPNWIKIMTVDVYGRLNPLPCWNNPAYRNWWLGTVEDLFKSYPLDGFKYGSERSGPLSNLFFGGSNMFASNSAPGCFCDYCRARGREKGINVERAREGYQRLYEFIMGVYKGQTEPRDGVIINLLRLLLKYPEMLAWEYQWHEAKEEVAKLMYSAIKAIAPRARVGWHIYHRGVTWDPFYRAEMDYADMVHYSDWLKPVVYHDIAGPRIHADIASLHRGALRELSEPAILDALYGIMGYDRTAEPPYETLANKGLSADYVYRETRRCVEAVQGRIPVYPGVGFDIPWKREYFPSAPEDVYRATIKAFEAGAQGMIISREYDEMRLENLRAVGRALCDIAAAGL